TGAPIGTDSHPGAAGSHTRLWREAVLHARQRFWLFKNAGRNREGLGRTGPRGYGPGDSHAPPQRSPQWLGRGAHGTRAPSGGRAVDTESGAVGGGSFFPVARLGVRKKRFDPLGRSKTRGGIGCGPRRKTTGLLPAAR